MTAYLAGKDTAMSEALYGLLGALGGALITGAAAFWGPLQTQRRAFAAERERRSAEQERAATAEETAQAQARREAETTRIIRMRTTTRAWSDFLARAIQDLGLGRPVDADWFDEQALAVRNEAQSALDHALHDGLWIWQSSYGWPPQLPHPVPPAHSPEQIRVLGALGRATVLTREAVIRGERLDTMRVTALRNALDKADEARGALNAALFNRLEEVVSVTAIGGALPRLPASLTLPAASHPHDETAASPNGDTQPDE
ncbi:hypothetical protein ACFQ9H_28035 [Streptomyces sp. NPDC056517]|uniref:hypothetical protein n=1 Tax=unclassified Streptomyces TaxID=2593676 RepID=UPI00368F1DA1